jgi:hypothetical protein
MDELDKLLAALLKDDSPHKELAGKIKAHFEKATGELDGLKAAKLEAEKSIKALTKERDKAVADFTASQGSVDEQVAKHKGAAEKAQADLATAQESHKRFKIDTKLGQKLKIPAGEDYNARLATALGALDRSGIDLDDKDELVGADAPIAALQKSHSFIFGEQAPPPKGPRGDGGGGGGVGKPLTPEGEKTAYERAQADAQALVASQVSQFGNQFFAAKPGDKPEA